MDRKLCGIFFRVRRNSNWMNVCFSDLSEDEMEEVLKNKNQKFLKSLCIRLGIILKEIGDQLDLYKE